MNDQELLSIVHLRTDDFGCNTAANCLYKERTLSYAMGVNVPTVGEDPDEIFKECCYNHYVFADAETTKDFKNDYSAFYHQKQLSNETCNFFLYEYANGTEHALTNDTYGQYFGFGFFDTNPNLKGFKVEWRKVLNSLGAGSYRVIKRITIAGISVETKSLAFTLKQYSSKNANHTVRIDIVMNGRLEKEGVDFKGTGWKHSIRIPAFFGRRDPKYTEDNIVTRTYNKRQISMSQNSEYKFQTNWVPVCITNEIIDFMLFANDIYMNDYNLNNHSYDYVKFPVKLNNNEGTQYGVKTRNARLNLLFEDRFANSIKRNF